MALLSFHAWRHVTPTLIFSCLVFLQGALLFGIDTGSFGSLQALPSFLRRFGVQNDQGAYILPPDRQSMMNSLPWLGKLLGCIVAESIIERLGYKKSIYAVATTQIIAVIIECTSQDWPQFTVGRIIAYAAVGLVENIVPAYNAEVSPAAIRGLFSASIIMVSSCGNLWGAGMSKAFDTVLEDKGWIIPTSVQVVPAVIILGLVPFTPESPRWLILKGRKEEAQRSLDRIRPKRDVESGATKVEADILQRMIRGEADAEETGSWIDLLRGTNLRRTWIVLTIFFIHQMNGNQFVNSYAATFYVQRGLRSLSFTYNAIGQAIGVIGCGIGLILLDIAGRRHLVVFGSAICAFLLYLAAGLGLVPNLSAPGANMLITCFILLPAFTRISASNIAFLTGAEIGGVYMRRKMMAFGTAADVVAAFLVTYVTPYLLPKMGVNIGWIFGSVAAFAVVWGWLFFPEIKGRSLEEVDELFEARIPAWRFKRFETHGMGRAIADLENEGVQLKEGVAEAQHEETPATR